MKKEVEVRIALSVPEKKRVVKALQSLGWRPFKKYEYDRYFCPTVMVENNTSKDSPFVIRLRASNEKKKLTYKSFRGKSWIEIESGIEDDTAIKKILEHLNLSEYLRIEKQRLSGTVGSVEINIDTIKKLGNFIELEIMTQNVAHGKKQLIDFAEKRLHLSIQKIVHHGYVQLMEQYNA